MEWSTIREPLADSHVFQPAEETGAGAKAVMNDERFAGIAPQVTVALPDDVIEPGVLALFAAARLAGEASAP